MVLRCFLSIQNLEEIPPKVMPVTQESAQEAEDFTQSYYGQEQGWMSFTMSRSASKTYCGLETGLLFVMISSRPSGESWIVASKLLKFWVSW